MPSAEEVKDGVFGELVKLGYQRTELEYVADTAESWWCKLGLEDDPWVADIWVGMECGPDIHNHPTAKEFCAQASSYTDVTIPHIRGWRSIYADKAKGSDQDLKDDYLGEKGVEIGGGGVIVTPKLLALANEAFDDMLSGKPGKAREFFDALKRNLLTSMTKTTAELATSEILKQGIVSVKFRGAVGSNDDYATDYWRLSLEEKNTEHGQQLYRLLEREERRNLEREDVAYKLRSVIGWVKAYEAIESTEAQLDREVADHFAGIVRRGEPWQTYDLPTAYRLGEKTAIEGRLGRTWNEADSAEKRKLWDVATEVKDAREELAAKQRKLYYIEKAIIKI